MKYRINGTTMQSLDVLLNSNEQIVSERGGMAWYKGNVDMKTNMPGGLMGGLGRMMSGESVFMTTYTSLQDGTVMTFTPEAPGSVIARELQAGEVVIAQRDSFMCAQGSVKLEMHFRRKLGAGLFGGEGFVLQKVTGPGIVFFEVEGEVVEVDLAAGERMRVQPGHIAMFDSSVNYDIEMIKGVGNVLLGGEGLFLATLTGPGKVYLQTMLITSLITRIAQSVASSSS